MAQRGVSADPNDLAEQILLQCDTGSAGCNGGSSITASNLVIRKGLSSESKWPYAPRTSYSNICNTTN